MKEEDIEIYKKTLYRALDKSIPGYDNGNYVNPESCYYK